MKERASIVPAGELEALLGDSDPLRVTLRGQQGVESLVNFLLCEVLPNPELKEIRRMRLGLKVDLLVAMGHVRSEDRPSFEKLDQVRNRFAHQADAHLDDKDQRDLENALGPTQRQMLGEFGPEPLDARQMVAAVALILHSQLWMAARHFRDGRISYEYSAKRLRDALNHVPRKTGKGSDEDLEEVLHQSHLERDELGEP